MSKSAHPFSSNFQQQLSHAVLSRHYTNGWAIAALANTLALIEAKQPTDLYLIQGTKKVI